MRGTSGKVVHFSEVALFPKLTFQVVLVLDTTAKVAPSDVLVHFIPTALNRGQLMTSHVKVPQFTFSLVEIKSVKEIDDDFKLTRLIH